MMKKRMALLLTVLMSTALLCACGNNTVPAEPTTQQTQAPTIGETEPTVTDATEIECTTQVQTDPVTDMPTESDSADTATEPNDTIEPPNNDNETPLD